MISDTEEHHFCLRKHRDFFEISRLINLNFDVDVIVAKGIAFIADQLKKRVPMYLLDDRGDLVIKQWPGDYQRELRQGIVVRNGDKEGVFTILNNIIYNGINFSPENSRITIVTKEEDEEVSFSVRSDTFIPRQHRERVFDYYYKIVGKEDKGTGLGLPIAKQVVENHRGTIKIISRERQRQKPFTRFIVKLPKRLERYH